MSAHIDLVVTYIERIFSHPQLKFLLLVFNKPTKLPTTPMLGGENGPKRSRMNIKFAVLYITWGGQKIVPPTTPMCGRRLRAGVLSFIVCVWCVEHLHAEVGRGIIGIYIPPVYIYIHGTEVTRILGVTLNLCITRRYYLYRGRGAW